MNTLQNAWKSSKSTRIILLVCAGIIFACCGIAISWGGGPDEAARIPTAPPSLTPRPAIVTPTSLPPTVTPEPTHTRTPQPTATRTPIPTKTPTPTPAMETARVLRIIDGDTIEVVTGGMIETVRLIGIDAPEVDSTLQADRYWADAATTAATKLLAGQTVYLEKDVSETDSFGRFLRYVYLKDGTMANVELVRLGVAQASSYPPDVQHQELLRAAGAAALAAGVGLYGPMPTQVRSAPIIPIATSTHETAPTIEPLPSATAEPLPTATQAAPAGAKVVIVAVNKRDEYVDIVNQGDVAQNLAGWVLISEKGGQACALGGVLEPGQALRIWAMAEDAGNGGYNCGLGTNIWNNSEPDPAALYDAAGNLVSRY